VSNYAEVAARIGKTEWWVRRHAHELPHHRFGRTYQFTAEDIAEIMKLHEHRPDTTEAHPAGPRPIGRGPRRSA
jgi:hypothetical protein